ncbi:hypothetical protein CR513_06213, partial [Mucuna pruriens]
MKAISLVLFTLLVLFIGIDNEGSLNVVEAKVCEVILYENCDKNCYTDCPKKFRGNAIGFCDTNTYKCMCRYECDDCLCK